MLQCVLYGQQQTLRKICANMEFEKQTAFTLLAVVFVAFSCASPTVRPESTSVHSGYTESEQCQVPCIPHIYLRLQNQLDHYHHHLFFLSLSLSLSSGHRCLHVQVHCYSAVLSGRLTLELHIVCRGQSGLLLR